MSKCVPLPYCVIYPIPINLVSRIFQDKKSIFVKYSPYEKISPRLESCNKILFYTSRSHKEILGEAEIVFVKSMKLSEVILNFSDKLFLNEDELRKYSNGRDEKKMIVFSLDKIKTYNEPKYIGHSITMAGEFISKEEYESIME